MPQIAKIILIGAGGHARVLADIIHNMAAQGQPVELVGYADPNPEHIGEMIAGKPVLGPDNQLEDLKEKHAITHFVVALGLMKGGQNLREKLYNIAIKSGISPIALIHPTACIASNVSIDPGSVLMAGVIINSDTHIGKNAIINTGAILEHDVHIASHTHIAPRATLLGGCQVGTTCMIGAGSVLVQGTIIHNAVTVAAGATVIKDVAEGTIVGGTPAKLLKA